jgi:hypothetical protein
MTIHYAVAIAFLAASIPLAAQQEQRPARPLSPDGIASAQVLGEWVELKSPAEWNLVVSGWRASPTFTPEDKQNTIYGAFGYTANKDLVRVTMRVEALPYRIEELAWEFLDMTTDSGRIAMRWDRSMASAPFRVAR